MEVPAISSRQALSPRTTMALKESLWLGRGREETGEGGTCWLPARLRRLFMMSEPPRTPMDPLGEVTVGGPSAYLFRAW